MELKKEKHLDFELLIFFLLVALSAFFIYIGRHPLLLSVINHYKFDISPLLKAYFIDLFIYLSILFPYITIIIILLILKTTRKIVRVKDNIMIILFFPLISFSVKTMSLMQIYIKNTFFEIFFENFYFYAFLFIGPFIIILHKAVARMKERRK